MAQQQLPGAALGILFDGQEEHGALGVESIATQTPVSTDTLFPVGSVSKPHTATALMRLVSERRVDLDATVRTYLPGLRLSDPNVAERVTVRHLLTHTGGWFSDAIPDLALGDDQLARFVDEALPTFPQQVPLGAHFSYNNSGVLLLGRVIEAVTGQPYRAAMRELLLGPLGLEHDAYEPDVIRRQPHVEGHDLGSDGVELVTPQFLPQYADPAGGLWSNTAELLRFVRFHLGDGTADGERLLSKSALGLMQTPQTAVPEFGPLQIGLIWLIQDLGGVRVISHAGDVVGAHTELVFLPEQGFAVVLLTNGSSMGKAVEQSVLAEAFRQYLGDGEIGAHTGAGGVLNVPDQTPRLTLPPERMAEYEGRYGDPSVGLTVRLDGSQLLLSMEARTPPGQIAVTPTMPPPPTLPLDFIAEDVATLGSTRLPFVRRPDGSIGWVSLGLRLRPREA
jgi:CubicO group peptidase (beta-lactamase class C family)